jgi:hypothetical protein
VYRVEKRDRVVNARDIPAPDAGVPEPAMVATEERLVLAYYAPDHTNRDIAHPQDQDEWDIAVLQFGSVRSSMFGPPNDEALNGHPLWGRGLEPYAAHWVEHSSWVRTLERMNSVHPMHNAKNFKRLRHFVLTFKESTFECVCDAKPSVAIVQGSTPIKAAIDAG